MTRRDFLPAVLTGAAADPTVARTDSERLAILRKRFGDDRLLDALQESGGRIDQAKRLLGGQRQREKRAATREERRNKRANHQLYRGPVTLSPEVRAILDAGRVVKSAMTHRPLIRATAHRLRVGELELGGVGIVLTIDGRNDAFDGGQLMAEVVDTGAGQRVHLYRPKMMSAKPPLAITL